MFELTSLSDDQACVSIVLEILLIVFMRGCGSQGAPYLVPAFCYLYAHQDQSDSLQFFCLPQIRFNTI